MSVTDDPDSVASLVPHPRDSQRNLQIQWLRAAAAIMVVLFHASVYGVVLLKNDRFLKLLDGRLGISGVSLFFAISGYLMAQAVKVQAPFTFLAHRVVRIYPTMLIVTALYCAVEYALHQNLRVTFSGLVLAPIGPSSNYPLRIEWTLIFEITFYVALFFIAAFGQARRLPWIAALWLVVLAGFSILRPDGGVPLFPVQRILTVCESVGMAGGLLIPTLLRLRLPPVLLILVGALAWPIFTLHPMENDGARWLFGIGATLIVAGAVGAAETWPRFGQNRLGRALASFGDDSYALYLIHVPVIYTLYSTIHGLSFPVLWALTLAVTIAGAVLVGRLDVALYRRLKAGLKTVPSHRLRVAMILYLVLFFGVSAGPSWKNHLLAVRQDTARGLAAQLVAKGAIATPADAESTALAAGFTPDAGLEGAVETARRDVAGQEIAGWAVDTHQKKGAALVAVFQNGHLLAAGPTWFARREIQQRFGTKAKAGFGFTPPGCDASGPVIGLILTPDRRFRVLPQGPAPDCTTPPSEP